MIQGRRDARTGTSPLVEVVSSAPFCMLHMGAWMTTDVPPKVPPHNSFKIAIVYLPQLRQEGREGKVLLAISDIPGNLS